MVQQNRYQRREQHRRLLEQRLVEFTLTHSECDEYNLPREGWEGLREISEANIVLVPREDVDAKLMGGRFLLASITNTTEDNPVLKEYFGRNRGMVACESYEAYPNMVGNQVMPAEDYLKNPSPLTENRRKALEALKKGDYEAFKKVIPYVFPVRFCDLDHNLYHGILPFANGTFSYPGSFLSQTQKLTPQEYVDRLERILLEGLNPSTNGVHHSSDPQIPGVYFTADTRDHFMPWGELVVVTCTRLLENPVFRCSPFNPFLCGDGFVSRDHIVYTHRTIIPKEPFRVCLKDHGLPDISDYSLSGEEHREIKSELERRKIHHTLIDPLILPPYSAIKR